MQAADGTLEQPLNGAARRVQQQERLPAMCDVWRLVGLVVMFFAVNTVVRCMDEARVEIPAVLLAALAAIGGYFSLTKECIIVFLSTATWC